MSLYDPERDRVRMLGRWLRWALRWVALPAALGMFVSGNIDVRSLPLFGQERIAAVLFLDGQAYFGHLDDSGENGTLILRDVYYFKNASGNVTGLPVGLVRRGTEAHEPADGMRINRERVFAIERVGLTSAVAQAVLAERHLAGVQALLSLNPTTLSGPAALSSQRTAVEHDLQRSWRAAADQLAKINELVLPIGKAEADTITQKALADLRAVRRNALTALAGSLGMSPADTEAYVRATDPALDAQAFANEPGVLLAPDLDAIVNRATQLYAQVGDAAAKQLTLPRATTGPSSTPAPTARP
jgi:hypothetical protein